MKVYYIGSPYMGCNYVRCLLPMWHNGWKGDIESIQGKRVGPMQAKQELMDSDVVVFHRPDMAHHHRVAATLKKMGKKIVFDNDDTFKSDDKFLGKMDIANYERNAKYKNAVTDTFIRNADLVTTSTKFLAQEYLSLNRKVKVLPNCVDQMDWKEPLRNEGGKVRIGIVGSVAYANDFEVIKDYLRELSERQGITMVLFGLHNKKDQKKNKIVSNLFDEEYAFWNTVDIEHVPWVERSEYNDTLNNLRLDLMLIPRQDSYFNRCKSNVKFLEAAMCEIPVVATTYGDELGSYDQDINGKNGFLVKNEEEWRQAVELLLQTKDLRLKMGKAAKEYALANYNIEDKASLWKKAYKNI